MAFPFNSNNNLLSEQAILAGIADVSAGQGVFRVSAITAGGTLTLNGDASNNRVSTIQSDAGNLMVSAKSSDAGLFRVSSILDSGSVSAKSSDAGNLRISAIIDNGSISAKSTDGNQFHVSALSPDAGLFHVSSFLDNGSVSAKSSDANQVHVSAVQSDGSLLRISALDSVVTTNTGGTSYFSTSAGIAQISTIKNTAGRLYGWYLGNPAGVDQYLQIFNASGGATLGTDVPAMTFYVPTLGGANLPAAGPGIGFSNGIQIAVTSTAAGNTAGASAMRVNIFYA